MKRLLILFLILSILLVGCAKVDKSVEENEVGSPTGPSSVKEESKGVDEISKPKITISKELKDLIDKADSVKSLIYTYSHANQGMKVYVKDNKMKQVFVIRSGTYAAGTRYDTVYLDLDKKTVVAYCEEPDDCDEEEINTQISVDYDDFITETPFDVLESVKYGEITGTYRIDGKDTAIVETEENGYTKKVWIWTYKGIPVKYEIWDNSERIKRVDYENMIVNDVSNSDLVH